MNLNSFSTRLPIILIMIIFFSVSCNNQPEKSAEKSPDEISVELEKKKLELQQKELELKEKELQSKEAAIDRKEEGMEAVESAKRQMEFERATECVASSPRAYFYTAPDPNTRKKAYLVKGDRFEPLRVSNNFVYVEFMNSNYVTTKGWISMDDLEVVY